MNAEIISVGTELLMGEIVDTNSSYLADELAKIGVDLRWATKVGDHPGRLEEAIARALDRSEVTITTGGLGTDIRRPYKRVHSCRYRRRDGGSG